MMLIGLLLALQLAFCSLATANLPVDLDKLPDFCDPTCEAVYNQSMIVDASLCVHPDIKTDPFYDPHQAVVHGDGGDLVRWEDVDANAVSGQWNIPSGLSLSRFAYVTEDVDGEPLQATAYALIPYHNPLGPRKPFRVVVWAHGTAGYSPMCAPSNNKGLQYHWQAPFALAQQGYLVIAPDYAGLGTPISKGFMYNAGIAHANDVSFAVTAARKSIGHQMSSDWVVVGHSEGGLTAWRTAEREANPKKAVGGLIGAVAIAPAMEVMSLIPWYIEKAHGGPLGEIFAPFMLGSIDRLFPSFDFAKYATQGLIDRVNLAYTGCLNVAVTLLAPLTLKEMYLNNANFIHAPEVEAWGEKYHGKGPHQLAAPLLVLHGEKDFILPVDYNEGIFDKQCDAFPDSAAEFVRLPGLDHDGAVQGSHANYFPWIADRFDKKDCPFRCVKSKPVPATDRFSTVEQVWVSGGQMLVQ
ncbi:Alpha/Beta hydrolase protein [Aspergillus egyptiacus]|nr:Alpha/Beta hydrolase protein [Aspergillus egyptiacus]